MLTDRSPLAVFGNEYIILIRGVVVKRFDAFVLKNRIYFYIHV